MSISPTVSAHRALRFNAIDDVVAELDRLIAAQRAGHLEARGNWTPAQIFEHLAKTIEGSYEGFSFRVSWPLRAVAHAMKWIAWKQLVDFGLRPGHQVPDASLLPDHWADFDVAAARLRAELLRIRRGEPMRAKSPLAGTISHDQWVYLHLRHAELHLGFLDVSGPE